MAGTSIGRCGTTRLVVATTRTGSFGQRRQRGADQVVFGVVRGAGRDEDQRRLAGGQLDLRVRDLEGHRAGDLDPGRPLARVLELREGADQRQLGADAAVEALDRRQVEALRAGG